VKYHVLTYGLSPDMKRVHPDFGRIDRGNVSRNTLFKVLEMYRQLETDRETSASSIAIQGNSALFIVRVSGKQLTLGVEGEPSAQRVPLAAEEIMLRLERPPAPDPLNFRPPSPPPEPRLHLAIALGLMAAGIALIGYALKPILSAESARPAGTVEFEAAELEPPQPALAGLFATGQQLGDRHLKITAAGHIVFTEIGPRNALDSRTDSFRTGRREKRTYLVTPRNGVIELVDANTLVYYDDTYRRVN
jgi:hypothetical protein